VKKKVLTIKEMHEMLRCHEVALRSLRSIKRRGKKRGYNMNYIRDWFKFGDSHHA